MIKTVSLTAGTETKVEIPGGYNVGVINRTTDMIYASRKSGIVAGADDVAAIPAGDSYVIRAADDTVYLLATAAGDVQLESIGAKEVFKIAATRTSSGGGAGGTDDVARQAIASHANNDEIHLTAEKAIEAAATAISNPNLLINPDFAVNQRGMANYSSTYTVDRWKTGGAKLTVDDGFISLENTTAKAAATIYQVVENPTALSGKTVVLSFDYDLKTEGAWISVQAVTNGAWNPSTTVQLTDTGRNVKSTVITLPENLTELRLALVIHPTDSAPFAAADIYGAKLEIGKIATPIIPADPATELLKCQRYYQVRSTGNIAAVDMRPSMATITDIKQRGDGNYEYIAEL